MDPISLHIAAGILIAALLLAAARASASAFAGGDFVYGTLLAAPVVLMGGGLIGAALGIFPW